MIFEDAYVDKNCLTYFSYKRNAIFKLNTDDKECSYIISLKEYDYYTERLYGKVTQLDNKLIFSPMASDFIMVFDYDSSEYKCFEINRKGINFFNDKEKFYSIQKYKNYIYIIGLGCTAIIRFDILSGNQKVYNAWENEFNKSICNGDSIFQESYITEKGKIIAPACYENKILEFDTDSGNWKIEEIPSYSGGYSGICFDGQNYYLCSMTDNKIFKRKNNTNNWEIIELPKNIGINQVQYSGIEYTQNHIIVQVAATKKFIKIDKNGTIQTIKLSNKDNRINAYRPLILIHKPNIDYVNDRETGELYIFNISDLNPFQKVNYKITNIDKIVDVVHEKGSSHVILENEIENLDFLFKFVKENEKE